jgi:hypothetical protein
LGLVRGQRGLPEQPIRCNSSVKQTADYRNGTALWKTVENSCSGLRPVLPAGARPPR